MLVFTLVTVTDAETYIKYSTYRWAFSYVFFCILNVTFVVVQNTVCVLLINETICKAPQKASTLSLLDLSPKSDLIPKNSVMVHANSW